MRTKIKTIKLISTVPYRPVGWSRDGFGITIIMELTAEKILRGWVRERAQPLPPSYRGYGGALEAPPGSRAEPQKVCKIAYQNHHLFYKFFNFTRITQHCSCSWMSTQSIEFEHSAVDTVGILLGNVTE